MVGSNCPFTTSEFLSNDSLNFTHTLSDEYHSNKGPDGKEESSLLAGSLAPIFPQSNLFQEHSALELLSDTKQIRQMVSETMFGSPCEYNNGLVLQRNEHEGESPNYIGADNICATSGGRHKLDVPSHDGLGIDPRSLSISSGYQEVGNRLAGTTLWFQPRGQSESVKNMANETIKAAPVKCRRQADDQKKVVEARETGAGLAIDPTFSRVLAQKLRRYSDSNDRGSKIRFQEISYRISKTYFR